MFLINSFKGLSFLNVSHISSLDNCSPDNFWSSVPWIKFSLLQWSLTSHAKESREKVKTITRNIIFINILSICFGSWSLSISLTKESTKKENTIVIDIERAEYSLSIDQYVYWNIESIQISTKITAKQIEKETPILEDWCSFGFKIYAPNNIRTTAKYIHDNCKRKLFIKNTQKNKPPLIPINIIHRIKSLRFLIFSSIKRALSHNERLFSTFFILFQLLRSCSSYWFIFWSYFSILSKSQSVNSLFIISFCVMW